MSNEFTPDQEGYDKKSYSKRQQGILDTIWLFGGDAVAAAKAQGYSNPYSAVDSLKDELIDMAEKAMARLSLKSVNVMEKVLDSDGNVKQANEKLKAAQLILDRTNPKTEKVDINAEVTQGIFVLPAKRPVEETEDAE